jgi:pyruvate kinase
METQTPQQPHHLARFKRTKIIATVGPATNSYEGILSLVKAGADGLRLNFSHASYEDSVKQIAWIRKAAKECDRAVAIIQDLQGPKIRLGDFDGVIPVEKGQELRFQYKSDYHVSGVIPTQYDLSKKVKRGERVMLYDGKVLTTVTSVQDGVVYARADNDGVLLQRKGINLPDTDFGGDVITKKDREDVAFGSTKDIDYIAQSFIQTANDLLALRKIVKNLGSNAKIIAKIETKAAIDDMENIIEAADAVMVARGDLAVETLAEAVPVEQRKIIGLCRQYAKPVIVATQMLASMTESTEPTRAEVSDVATAVIIGTDCVMLSEETAMGKHPALAVKTMKRVIMYTEKHQVPSLMFNDAAKNTSKQAVICDSVVVLASQIKSTAIVAETKSGATAIQLASRRPKEPILAVTSDIRVAQQLALAYDVTSYVRPDSKQVSFKLTNWLVKTRVLKEGDVIITAAGQYPGVIGTTDTIKVRVL